MAAAERAAPPLPTTTTSASWSHAPCAKARESRNATAPTPAPAASAVPAPAARRKLRRETRKVGSSWVEVGSAVVDTGGLLYDACVHVRVPISQRAGVGPARSPLNPSISSAVGLLLEPSAERS